MAHSIAAIDFFLPTSKWITLPGNTTSPRSAHGRQVDLQQLLLGMLAAAGGRNACHRALKNLKQRLLNALARNIAGNGEVLGLAGNLVDLVNVDDANLRALNVAIGSINELERSCALLSCDFPQKLQSSGLYFIVLDLPLSVPLRIIVV